MPNLDERNLRQIQEYKKFYEHKLEEADTELERDLIQIRINQYTEMETEILERCCDDII